MGRSVARKVLDDHIVDGTWQVGQEIGLRVDQTLMHDASGPTIIQELESLGLDSARTDLTVVYVDHNMIQADNKSADDHDFLRSAAASMGFWYSPAGNGISHPVHLERFARPGHLLIGGDSHSVGAGAVGMFAVGAGGIDVSLATAGHPYYVRTPEIIGVELVGQLPPWSSAKDVALEMLRRFSVTGAVGNVVEYFGPALDHLTVWDRHVLSNMGLEMGALATIFPSDAAVLRFLEAQGRADQWVELRADDGADVYDRTEIVDLSAIGPLVAKPHSPDNVVPVEEVVGTPIGQAYVGSSANPGYRDFAVVAQIVRGHQVPPNVSLDINPSTRTVLAYLSDQDHLLDLVRAGGRIHQAGCNGCVGIGQAPATGVNSIRTSPRNFKGRTGTLDDSVFLASPETVAASALAGVITDPRTLGATTTPLVTPDGFGSSYIFQKPLPDDERRTVEIIRGPNIKPLPDFDPLPEDLDLPVVLRLGDNVSTDDIMPAQQEQLPWRSNIELFSDFVFCRARPEYVDRAKAARPGGGHAIVGGRNYGQGSAREHATLSPRYLGLRVVLAESFARIYSRNLVNFGILPLRALDPSQLDGIGEGDVLQLPGLASTLRAGERAIHVVSRSTGIVVAATHDLTDKQVELVLAGGVLTAMRGRFGSRRSSAVADAVV
jgi:aconitate hydratase